MGTNPTAGTAADARRVASVVAQAGAVASFRQDAAPTTARAATMYLQANRQAGGPRPVRHASPWGAWWTVPDREAERCERAARWGVGVNPAGQLADTPASELAAARLEQLEQLQQLLEDDQAEPP